MVNKQTLYRDVLLQASGLFEQGQHPVSLYANVSALLKQTIPYISWVGFYLNNGKKALYLGPFQGLVACVDIPFDRGVCGKAAREQQTVIVDDVHTFPGHIACDAGSRSEIVVPFMKNGQLLGVLDVDSYELAAFDEVDAHHLTTLLESLAKLL
jgi:GAF domain-containing protein